MVSFAAETTRQDRRRSQNVYYPLKLGFSYLAYRRGHVIQRGIGETVEMSRAGIRVRPIEIVPQDATDIKLSIAWPATLDDGTRLQFVVQGKPQWNGSQLVEVIMVKHEFRTASKGAALIDSMAGDTRSAAQSA
jgi:hypothetical protein